MGAKLNVRSVANGVFSLHGRRSSCGQAARPAPFDRLPEPFGLFIDRAAAISFTFEGRAIPAYSGDTVASALHAAGLRTIVRSPHVRRRRGLFSEFEVDTGVWIDSGSALNCRADTFPVADGMICRAIDMATPAGRPGANGATVTDRAVGLNGDSYRPERIAADVAIVGGGASGLSAAVEAGESGASVVVVERRAGPGGRLLYERSGADRAAESALLAGLHARLVDLRAVRFLTETTVVGVSEGYLTALGPAGPIRIAAPAVIGAVGGVQQPLVFAGNDLPGVMTVGSAQRLMRLYGVKPGRRAIVAAVSEVGYGAALDLIEAGIQVAAVLDLRSDSGRFNPEQDPCVSVLREKSVRIETDIASIRALEGADGAVGRLRMATWNGGGVIDHMIDADLILAESGFSPEAMLAIEAGCKLDWNAGSARIEIKEPPAWFFPVGRFAGADNIEQSAASGTAAARRIAAGAASADGAGSPALQGRRSVLAAADAGLDSGSGKRDCFLEYGADISLRSVEEIRTDRLHCDGFDLAWSLRRLCRGPGRGAHGLNAVLRRLGPEHDGIDLTAVAFDRGPTHPVPLGVCAALAEDGSRGGPLAEAQVALGAVLEPECGLLRPAFYGDAARRERIANEEAEAIRINIGLADRWHCAIAAVVGWDAANVLSAALGLNSGCLTTGAVSPFVLHGAAGGVLAAGCLWRENDSRFIVQLNAGGFEPFLHAVRVAGDRSDADVERIDSSGVFLSGPVTRRVLTELGWDQPAVGANGVSGKAVQVRLGEMPIWLARLDRFGVPGCEIIAPTAGMRLLWSALVESGRPKGLRPVGADALDLLALERGAPKLGRDVGPGSFEEAWRRGRGGYGDLALARFALLDPPESLPGPGLLVVDAGRAVGCVTSLARSDAFGGAIGMAHLPTATARPGAPFTIRIGPGEALRGQVIEPLQPPIESKEVQSGHACQ